MGFSSYPCGTIDPQSMLTANSSAHTWGKNCPLVSSPSTYVSPYTSITQTASQQPIPTWTGSQCTVSVSKPNYRDLMPPPPRPIRSTKKSKPETTRRGPPFKVAKIPKQKQQSSIVKTDRPFAKYTPAQLKSRGLHCEPVSDAQLSEMAKEDWAWNDAGRQRGSRASACSTSQASVNSTSQASVTHTMQVEGGVVGGWPDPVSSGSQEVFSTSDGEKHTYDGWWAKLFGGSAGTTGTEIDFSTSPESCGGMVSPVTTSYGSTSPPDMSSHAVTRNKRRKMHDPRLNLEGTELQAPSRY